MMKITIRAKVKIDIQKVLGHITVAAIGAFTVLLFGLLVQSGWSSEICGFIYTVWGATAFGSIYLIDAHWGTLDKSDIEKVKTRLRDVMETTEATQEEMEEIGIVERFEKKRTELEAKTDAVEAINEANVEAVEEVIEPAPEPEPSQEL